MIYEMIKDYNKSGKPWKCVKNCSFCKIPYCVQEGFKSKNEKRQIVTVSPKGEITYHESITACADFLKINKCNLANFLKGKRGKPRILKDWIIKYRKEEL